jgi:hypothetical protein
MHICMDVHMHIACMYTYMHTYIHSFLYGDLPGKEAFDADEFFTKASEARGRKIVEDLRAAYKAGVTQTPSTN